MEQTIVLNGIEYILIPKANVNEIKQQETTSQRVADTPIEEDILSDFLDNSPVNTISSPKEQVAQEDKPTMPTEENVMIVDATKTDFPMAPSRKYDYRERFVRHELTPADVVNQNRFNPRLVRDFKETDDLIRRLDGGKDPDKISYGFYGPGIEVDIV